MERKSKTEYYLDLAKAASTRSTCLRRHYGCVIVKNDVVISTGYNGSPRGEENCCDRGTCPRADKPHNSGDYSDCCAVHAEMNAIIFPRREEMCGSVMYLYGEEDGQPIQNAEPCPICKKLMKNAGILGYFSM